MQNIFHTLMSVQPNTIIFQTTELVRDAGNYRSKIAVHITRCGVLNSYLVKHELRLLQGTDIPVQKHRPFTQGHAH